MTRMRFKIPVGCLCGVIKKRHRLAIRKRPIAACLKVELGAFCKLAKTSQEIQSRIKFGGQGKMARTIMNNPAFKLRTFEPREHKFEALIIRLLHSLRLAASVPIASCLVPGKVLTLRSFPEKESPTLRAIN